VDGEKRPELGKVDEEARTSDHSEADFGRPLLWSTAEVLVMKLDGEKTMLEVGGGVEGGLWLIVGAGIAGQEGVI
jgi:hypothetical protein